MTMSLPRSSGPVPGPFFGMAAVAGCPGSVDLAAFGYCEEEWFLTGGANVYRDGDDGDAVVRDSDVPYATRVIVRRPSDPARSSGVVHLELLNPSLGYDVAITWVEAWRGMLRAGDTYVGLTCKQIAIENMAKWFDAARYESLGISHNGQAWDIVGQVAGLLGSDSPSNPLPVPARRVHASGWSQTGMYLRTYLTYGFDDLHGTIDGYLVGVAGDALGAVRPDWDGTLVDPDARVQGARAVITGHVAPVIELLSEDEVVMGNRRRPDSDSSGDRYRLYETTGRGHVGYDAFRTRFTTYRQITDAGYDYVFTVGELPEANHDLAPHVLTTRHLNHAILRHLDRWAAFDVAPPHADPIELRVGAEGAVMPRTDTFGISKGGLRTTHVDVPVAAYEVTGEPPLRTWSTTPFTTARVRELYGDRAGYLEQVSEAVAQRVAEGWYDTADAEEVLAVAGELTL